MALSPSASRMSMCLVLLSCVYMASAWKGNIEPYGRWTITTCNRCLCRYSWGCSLWRSYRCCRWTTSYRCKAGWKHNGNKNCNVPICYPGCNNGQCVRPNSCTCPTTSTGQFCQTLTCSYQRPCYPGNCMNVNQCNCTTGFEKETPTTGCLEMTDVYEPFIGQSTTIISNIRRTDNKLIYYFQLDGDPSDGTTNVVWSNQNEFNDLSFMFESQFTQPEELPARPAYVHELGLGIVSGEVTIGVTDYKGDTVSRAKQKTECMNGPRPFSPVEGVYNCTIRGQIFRTNMEHGDTLKVTFLVTSGGFRQMINLDQNGNFLTPETIAGPSSSKVIMFKFDLIAPKHCSEANSTVRCATDENVLKAKDEFTKKPIELSWKGWYDDPYGAGMWQYYLELHRLVVNDAVQDLTESNPTGPMATALVQHEDNTVMTHTFTPTEPGVFSVLIEARDKGNNSRIARRIVTYDPDSEITVQTTGPGLHVTSATAESGYTWQSADYNIVTGKVVIAVSWEGYFRNTRHETGNYLNKVRDFPPQFNDLKDDGILSANKFVDPDLDDFQGRRTLEEIANIHGIVRFTYRTDKNSNWSSNPLLSESMTLTRSVEIGDSVQIWVRAEDMMGNTRTESTIVRIDTTAPKASAEDEATFILNDNSTDSNFSFPSRIEFEAFDYQSGVKTIMIQVLLHTPGKPDKLFNTTVPANFGDDPTASGCYGTKDPSLCFIKEQTVFLDNCWFMAPTKSDLLDATATVNIIVSNQAGLKRVLAFTIDEVASLRGLDYDGPLNPRIEDATTTSFRVVWDLPEVQSCYGRADVILVLALLDSEGRLTYVTHEVSASSTYFDVGGLQPGTTYDLVYKTKLGGGGTTDGVTLQALTAVEEEETNYTPVIVGSVIGVLVIIILAIVLLVVLIRRGVVHPPEPVRRVQRAVTKRYRETFYGGAAASPGVGLKTHVNKTYDNNEPLDMEELYIYGGMELDDHQMWHLNRDDIVFESLIKSGHFANVYKARINNYSDVVAIKTLKEKHTPADELLMKAKINFTGSEVGTHPNVVKFIGAVMTDDTMGPMIIYEYCENGTLKEYLEKHRDDVTIQLQENLFRFGRDVAKGMEYLAGQRITHKRLAARNILLTFVNEAKIAGFGPQPVEDEEAESGKKERVPIKWMAPECTKTSKDSTEKSDVWSYGVLLWEIFSLGSTPYGNTKARDIPGKLRKGERLGKPEQCDDVWFGVMTRCWSYDAASRPTFTDIRSELDTLFVASADNEDYYYYQR